MLRLIWKEVQWDHCPLIRDQDFSFLEARSGQKTSSTVPLKFSIFSFSFLKSRHHSFGVRNVPYLWRIWLSKIVFSCSPFFSVTISVFKGIFSWFQCRRWLQIFDNRRSVFSPESLLLVISSSTDITWACTKIGDVPISGQLNEQNGYFNGKTVFNIICFPTALTVGFQSRGHGMVRSFFLIPKTGTTPWNHNCCWVAKLS